MIKECISVFQITPATDTPGRTHLHTGHRNLLLERYYVIS